MSTWTLVVDIHGYWHPGTGRGSGFHLDALSHENSRGLPALPGRSLKGLLRDAAERAAAWGWPGLDGDFVVQMFGRRSDEAGSSPGLIRLSDAALPETIAGALAADRDLVAGLYRDLFATAMNEYGVALDKSLRGLRAVVPLTLEAEISLLPGQDAAPPDWPERLRRCLPLIRAVGGHRSRGFGRATLSLKEAAR